MIQDFAQEEAAKRLTKLQEALEGYTNEPIIAQIEHFLTSKKDNEMETKEETKNSKDGVADDIIIANDSDANENHTTTVATTTTTTTGNQS